MDFITQYWPQIVALVLCIIWSVRLEGRLNVTARDVSRLDQRHSEARTETNTKLDRMDDKLDRSFQEIRNSISAIYQQGVPK